MNSISNYFPRNLIIMGALGGAAATAYYDPAIAKIFAGAIFTTSGFVNMASLSSSKKKNNQDTQQQWILGISLIAIGCIALAWGTNDLLSGTNDPALKLIDIMMKEQSAKDIAISNQLIKKIQGCPDGKKLWDDTLKLRDGKISVILGSPQQVPSFGFWHPSTHTIAVNRDLQPFDDKVQKFLFEICNANQFNKEIVTKALSGKLSKMDYVKGITKIEYSAAKLHHQIASNCIKKNGWHPNINHFRSLFEGDNPIWATFNSMWTNFQADSSKEVGSHLGLYSDQWDQAFKISFCQNNPHHSDCI